MGKLNSVLLDGLAVVSPSSIYISSQIFGDLISDFGHEDAPLHFGESSWSIGAKLDFRFRVVESQP
ncbi:uncharacterized protein G2W53_014025 [Senna tora]|uniref:Uncharacterized protein n=1 Tax=Senna tora TaxID=362788 RepID=A0A834U0A1_9FABA|nr:uncharacterized protein G2W53_014025 [Senna tora]